MYFQMHKSKYFANYNYIGTQLLRRWIWNGKNYQHLPPQNSSGCQDGSVYSSMPLLDHFKQSAQTFGQHFTVYKALSTHVEICHLNSYVVYTLIMMYKVDRQDSESQRRLELLWATEQLVVEMVFKSRFSNFGSTIPQLLLQIFHLSLVTRNKSLCIMPGIL